ncbi:MAG: hypothetical protein ACMUHX_06070 [bacterium]
MKIKIGLLFALAFFIIVSMSCPGIANAKEDQIEKKEQKIDMDIGINQEDRDVGLKRMEIIDKALSPELVERKRSLVHSIEQDYDTKISKLLQRLTTPIGQNTVITHIDVNFFDTEFESQVYASQKASVSIILGRDGFNKWAENTPEQEALKLIKQMISRTFKIPDENISILVAPN